MEYPGEPKLAFHPSPYESTVFTVINVSSATHVVGSGGGGVGGEGGDGRTLLP
jgi:hypothetical protein